LRTNWQQSYQQPDLRRFLICVLIYHAGVHTVITLAAVYAQQVMGFSIQQTIMLILIVNITAAIGAWAFGFLQDRLSHRNSLSIALVFWLLMVLIAWQAHDETTFWIAANFAGIAMGASQSGARAAIAYLSRADRQAETFGLWGVAINMAAVLGPVTYGLVTWLSQNDQRLAMVVTGVFFLVGLAVLWTVNFERGRHAANSD
jgi:MFS transporter, UMF1 family